MNDGGSRTTQAQNRWLPREIHTNSSACTAPFVTKSCTEILKFSTRFSCQHFAVEYFVTLFMGKSLVNGEMLCLGTVSTNLFRLFYAGEIQNLNCRRLEMVTYFFLTRGCEICKRRQSCCSTVSRTLKHRHKRMWRFYHRSRIVGG